MTVSTLRPNSTVSNSGVVVTGAGGVLHTALSDDSDSSYAGDIDATDTATLGLGDLTLPAGAIIKRFALRARLARTSAGTSHVSFELLIGGSVFLDFVAVNSTSPTTITVFSGVGGLTDADADAAQVKLLGNGGAASDLVRIHEVYLDITYVLKPVVTVNAMGV